MRSSGFSVALAAISKMHMDIANVDGSATRGRRCIGTRHCICTLLTLNFLGTYFTLFRMRLVTPIKIDAHRSSYHADRLGYIFCALSLVLLKVFQCTTFTLEPSFTMPKRSLGVCISNLKEFCHYLRVVLNPWGQRGKTGEPEGKSSHTIHYCTLCYYYILWDQLDWMFDKNHMNDMDKCQRKSNKNSGL